MIAGHTVLLQVFEQILNSENDWCSISHQDASPFLCCFAGAVGKKNL